MKSVINLPLHADFFFSFFWRNIEMLQKDCTPSAKGNKEALSQGNGQVMARQPPSSKGPLPLSGQGFSSSKAGWSKAAKMGLFVF